MPWIGLWDEDTSLFDPQGLGRTPAASSGTGPDLLTRGSIVMETKLAQGPRPQVLFSYASGGAWPVQISVQSIPGGGATLIVDQAGDIAHGTVRQTHTERLEALRFTYSWDAPRKWGRLAMEHVGGGSHFSIADVPAPPPLRLRDLRAMVCGGPGRFITPDMSFLAVSTGIEPIGPLPTLTARTPILTPTGEKPVAALRRGDTIRTDSGEIVPVLYRLSRSVPARGAFAPVRLRAPYLGLRRDIVVGPTQRLKITGSTVEYMFGTEAVLANARDLTVSTAHRVDPGPVITYHQLILARHEAVCVAGTALESLYVGRLRRKKPQLAATLLQDLDRSRLPEHRAPAYPLLRQYEALVLAEQRSA